MKKFYKLFLMYSFYLFFLNIKRNLMQIINRNPNDQYQLIEIPILLFNVNLLIYVNIILNFNYTINNINKY